MPKVKNKDLTPVSFYEKVKSRKTASAFTFRRFWKLSQQLRQISPKHIREIDHGSPALSFFLPAMRETGFLLCASSGCGESRFNGFTIH
ncbi:MAG: hypothetical protein NTX75_00335 [Proteobacteria bacterium]|nr:hypothetical protein [Pseudomonadota bacterium]